MTGLSYAMSSAHSDSESDPIQLPLPSSPPVSETTNTCFLCKKSGVKNFNAETLSKAQMCLKIKKFYNLSGKDVVLPENLEDKSIGYCSRPCYKNFVTINSRYKLPEEK